MLDFARELQTQIEGIQAPMEHLAALSGRKPRYGAFAEAWILGESEQAAVEEMHGLLGQVRQAIAFTTDVTGTVAAGYRQADEDVAASLGHGTPDAAPPGQGHVQGQQSRYVGADYPMWPDQPGVSARPDTPVAWDVQAGVAPAAWDTQPGPAPAAWDVQAGVAPGTPPPADPTVTAVAQTWIRYDGGIPQGGV